MRAVFVLLIIALSLDIWWWKTSNALLAGLPLWVWYFALLQIVLAIGLSRWKAQ